MASLLAAIGSLIGAILAQLWPAIGEELRKNNQVKQKGNDDVTHDMVDDYIWDAANHPS